MHVNHFDTITEKPQCAYIYVYVYVYGFEGLEQSADWETCLAREWKARPDVPCCLCSEN